MSRIGFIGLGAMGGPMVGCLLRAGHRVLVHDVAAEAVDRLAADGAEAAGSAAAAAAGSELVVTMLPRAQDVADAVLGPDGVAAGIGPGATLVDASTIDIGTIRSLEGPLAERGASLLDAGVSGSPAQAAAGSVTFIVGGDPALVERHRATFEALAATVVYAGPLGCGKAMKLANNQMAAIIMAGLAEAFTLLVANGADPATAKGAMERSWAKTALLDLRPPLPGLGGDGPADHDYRAEFSIDYMAKDLGAVIETARQAGVVLLTTGLVRELFVAAGARGDGQLDMSALIRTTRGLGRQAG